MHKMMSALAVSITVFALGKVTESAVTANSYQRGFNIRTVAPVPEAAATQRLAPERLELVTG
jgi:hypothetical protein